MCSMVRDDETDAVVLVRAGDERVRVEQREGLGVLAPCVALELLAAHRERLEEARDGHGGAPLCAAVSVREADGIGKKEEREGRGEETDLAGSLGLLRFGLAGAVEVDDCACGGVCGGRSGDGDGVR